MRTCAVCGAPADPRRVAVVYADPDAAVARRRYYCSEACEARDEETVVDCCRCGRPIAVAADGWDLRDARAYNSLTTPDGPACLRCLGRERAGVTWDDEPWQ